MVMKFLIALSFFTIVFHHFRYVNSDSPLAPALYVLGDSLFDSGNNNFFLTLAKANFWPYGVSFTSGSTGRFTNGKTVVDFIAEFLGLPFCPPYMSFRGSLPLTGLNYASASCGILPETGSYIGKCLNLDDQINLFRRTAEQQLPRHYQTSKGLSEYLSKSIFVISIGSNDYINNYLQPIIYDTSQRYTPQSFAKLLIDRLFQQLQKLFALGGRKFVVFEIGPLGCIPPITRQYKHNGTCVEDINQLAISFNDKLAPMLQNLTSTLNGSAFILGHVYWLGYDAIINSANYGLTDSSYPCGTSGGNGTLGCIPGLQPCTDIDHHYFWDGYHLTEAVYSVLGRKCFNETNVCIPFNIKELVNMKSSIESCNFKKKETQESEITL